MTYYTRPAHTHGNRLEFVGQNKKRAIAAAKKRAVEIQQSVAIIAIDTKKNEWIYIGIAEYPYYLRGLNLEPRDILMNFFK